MSQFPDRIKFQSDASLVSSEVLDRASAALATVLARTDLGFVRLPSRENLLAAVEARARDVARSSTHLVVLGIGGSALGGRALLSAVPKSAGHGRVTFLDNIDSDRFWSWLRARNDLDAIHWLIVSKSGNTLETLCMADLVDQHLRASGHRRLSAVSTVVSEIRDNPLTHWARKESVPVLEIPVDVGGRFSVLSAVGLMPAAYSGLRLEKMALGAKSVLESEESREVVVQLTAQFWSSFARSEWVTMLWSYSEGLRDFGQWWQQLWAESLAKTVTRSGAPAPRVSTPIPAIGANDQHSLLQQVMEGARDKFLIFQRVATSEAPGPRIERSLFAGQEFVTGRGLGEVYQAECEATVEALSRVGVKTATLTLPVLDEQNLAHLFMTWELVIAALGEMLDVDAFNQPGVELGKVLAKRRLKDGSTEST